MSNLADLKGALTRMDEAAARAKPLDLTAKQRAALDDIVGGVTDLAGGLHELLLDKPVGPVPDLEPQMQEHLDAAVATLTVSADRLEAWLDGRGA